jgi:hypothetical protein
VTGSHERTASCRAHLLSGSELWAAFAIAMAPEYAATIKVARSSGSAVFKAPAA